MKKLALPLWFTFTLIVLSSPAHVATAAEITATATAIEAPIKRFSQVGPSLYRGGQPDQSDLTYLRDLGIRTIVSLREEDDERAVVESLGMKFVHIPLTFTPFGRTDLPRAAVEKFLQVVDDPTTGPVFVHCKRGADRTGAVVGLYRVLRQNWTVDRAYLEAREIGMRWWYTGVKKQLEGLALALRVPAAE